MGAIETTRVGFYGVLCEVTGRMWKLQQVSDDHRQWQKRVQKNAVQPE